MAFLQTTFIHVLTVVVFLADHKQLVASAICGYPGSPAHATVRFSSEQISPGTIATYFCDQGFELLGQPRRICNNNGTWTPTGIPFCVLNVAAGKAPMQSSVAGRGMSEKAVDGSTSTFFDFRTCTMTKREKDPWWYVNLLEVYVIQLVRVDFGMACCSSGQEVTVVVRVGNNRPDLGVNPICNKFTGFIEEGRPLYVPCVTSIPGAFVSVHLETPSQQTLSICEVLVYSDRALPIERCPSFRDQPLGSTSTYSGKCYIFYDNQPKNFTQAREFCQVRGGSLVDETSPALQGFLSWEMYRRHRNRPTTKFWMGAVRDPKEPKNWKWINGNDVTISFWNLPATNQNCSAYDGSRGWLWSDTDCNANYNFICQHKPQACGQPERPPNSTLNLPSLTVGSVVEYACDPGHLLVGPNTRTCLASSFFSQFPPSCRYLECGPPASIPNGGYELSNGTRYYLSSVQYFCNKGFKLIGRSLLTCDVDSKWNGPPPTCRGKS
ncbi:sushi, von Willebrand factor type A, EGF and pentraxin domain-containing protein 1-like [Tachypleus tridentatus]|uniref:sushi, von Willebrand factor type A, EGF and pentraxin domain-containing protein 1-like n=1 Tax=Tachypleus tridentatus TaxID=6853 RepID=UPI003FD112F7